jgi:biopolymer transport protein ExbB/TolQ
MLQMIKAFALLGGEWVLYILLGLSVWSIAVIWDRFFLFRKKAKESEILEAKAPELLIKGQIKEVQKLVENLTSPAAAILRVGIDNLSAGPEALEQILGSQRIHEKLALEKNLLVLGTLGSNAPFIGLFGTVLGIIKAFNDLALAGTSGPTVVMRGVSEALVATAVGLLIAIPCVATYNYFQNWIKRELSNSDRLSALLLAYAKKVK